MGISITILILVVLWAAFFYGLYRLFVWGVDRRIERRAEDER